MDDAVDGGPADAVFSGQVGQGDLAFGVAAADGTPCRFGQLGPGGPAVFRKPTPHRNTAQPQWREFEANIGHQRTREGMALAKRRGKLKDKQLAAVS